MALLDGRRPCVWGWRFGPLSAKEDADIFALRLARSAPSLTAFDSPSPFPLLFSGLMLRDSPNVSYRQEDSVSILEYRPDYR
jgi:hypothetical protein